MKTTRTFLTTSGIAASAALMLSIFCAGCGKKSTDDATPTSAAPASALVAQTQTPAQPAPLTLPSYNTRGMEMAQFGEFVANSHKKFSDVITANDLDMGYLALVMPLMTPMLYDALEKGALKDTKSGKLQMSGWNGKRTRTGDEVRGTSEFTYAEETGYSKVGDKAEESCTLNIKNNSLVILKKKTRGSKLLERSVQEITVQPDKTVTMHIFSTQLNPQYEDRDIVMGSVHFFQFNADQGVHKHVTGDLKAAAVDLGYESIVGKTTPDIDAIARKHLSRINTTTIKDGKVKVTN